MNVMHKGSNGLFKPAVTPTGTTTNGRLRFIAYLQIIGIILVVFGHSLHEYPLVKSGKIPLIYGMMYSFRMPLFMFVSGFLMMFTTYSRGKVRGVNEFVKGKILRLLLPFAVLSLVTFYPRTLMSGMADDAVELSGSSFIKSFFLSDSLVIPYFWFLQASFLLLTFNYIILRIGSKAGADYKKTTLLLVIFFFAIPFLSLPYELNNFFSIGRAIGLGIFFTAGMAYCCYSDKIDRFIPWTSVIFLTASVTVWAILYFCRQPVACGIAGIIACVSVAKLLTLREKCFIDHLVGANYIIFLLSWYFNVLTQQILSKFVPLPWWVHTLLSLTCGIYIPWLAYRYLKAHPDNKFVRITAFLLGQNIKK